VVAWLLDTKTGAGCKMIEYRREGEEGDNTTD
jgi:hypothetical protein